MFNLNQQQSIAVKFIDGPLFVLAGAGSGKTKVITSKIAYLIEDCGIKAHKIVAVTFTNKAAKEMKQRVKLVTSKQKAKGLSVSTFHTFGLKILRQHHQELDLNKNFTIADTQDVSQLISAITKKDETEDKDKIAAIIRQISNWKNQLISPSVAIANAKTELEQHQALAYKEYERILVAYNMVDFDDLISKPVYLFKNNADILKKWQYKIHYLLIDEYQDTNIAQYELVKMLIQHSGRLTVVGDDDQSIYSWRGANPNNLTMLQQDYPNLKVIKLEQNYRSTSNILQAANAIIANNDHIYDKKLWSDLGIGEKLTVIKTDSEDSEAERVAAEILTHRLRNQNKYFNYAVLFRSNFQARVLELKLQSYGIPYQLTGGLSFFARREIKDIMCYLRLLVNPDDDAAFLRIINTPKREIGSITLEKLSNFAKIANLSLEQACIATELTQYLSASYVAKLQEFVGWIQNLRQMLQNSSEPMDIIKQFITETGYEDFIHRESASSKQAEKKLGNINLLLANLSRNINKQNETADEDDVNIEQSIANLILRDILERQEEENNTDKVQLLTIHAAKGLEFDHVFLLGVEEGILPHKNSIVTEDITEERRLIYVGITRAKKTITLTMAAKRKIANEKIDTSPSRFIDEIPEHMVEFIGFTQENSQKVTKLAAEQGLASLYETLNI